jgi:hypothetical protein
MVGLKLWVMRCPCHCERSEAIQERGSHEGTKQRIWIAAPAFAGSQ